MSIVDANPIRFVDLRAQGSELGEAVAGAVRRTLERGVFILGEEVALLESEFASYCGASQAVGVDSGTSALELILRALDIGPGDEVVTVANSFVATALAISHVGATPVFVDVNPGTKNMRPDAVEAVVSPRTRAIIPVHLYGQPADMQALLELAQRRGLALVEDACQAHGALYKGQRAGSFGTAAAFSFYPSKNLGAAGDAGMVVTSDPQLAERVRRLRNYGQARKNESTGLGFNKRLDEIQAAILRVKLPHLDDWNARRSSSAIRYFEALMDSAADVQPPVIADDVSSAWHLFVVEVSDRETAQRELAARGIESGVHYPVPIPLQPLYEGLGYVAEEFPVSYGSSTRQLSLPMHPNLTQADVDRVVDVLAAATAS